MKVGELYTLSPQYHNKGYTDWEGTIALYVGESIINRTDGVRIVNLAFLLNGEHRITDQSFLRCIEVLSESR